MLTFVLLVPGTASAITVSKLTCEMAVNPVSVNTTTPRFGWQLQSVVNGDRQSACELVVTAEASKTVVWQSGKVKSDGSQLIGYAGKSSLEKGKAYSWKVRVWDAKGKASAWSAPARFSVAPSTDFFDAHWIGAVTKADSHLPIGKSYHVPSFKSPANVAMLKNLDSMALRSIMLRKDFKAETSVKKATVYVCGLGHYQLSINGKKVGNSEFAPLWSDYSKTVYYNTYDVSDRIQNGENAIGVVLGNGFYNTISTRYSKLWRTYGPPTLFFKMVVEYADGKKEIIRSDKSWKYVLSPITFNSIYGGEDYDATLEQPGWNIAGFNDHKWRNVVLQDAPEGKLTAQTAPPVQIHKQYGIKDLKHLSDSVYVLDMGQNLSGFPSIKIHGKKGQTVRLWVGESLDKDGKVSQKRTGAPYYFQYTLKGNGDEEWQPMFSYYGYQYIQVEGADVQKSPAGSTLPLITDIKSNFVYSSATEVATFDCSNEIFNKTHWLINNAIKSNFQGVMTDCPQREKLGWIEELHLNGPGLLMNYDMTAMFPKILRDMSDAQHADGLVPSICPEYVSFGGDFTDSPEWGCASIVVPWMYYWHYGDQTLIRNYYSVMTRYVDYLGTKATGHILSHGLGDWYDYGVKPAGYSQNSSIAISATSHYYLSAMLVAKAAALLGIAQDTLKYGQLMRDIKKAYNERFFNTSTRQYDIGSQFANAVSLYLGLVEPQYRQAVLKNLTDDIAYHGDRLTTGDVGNRYLFQTLADNGQNELMYKMVNHYDAPGYGFQLKYGLTTLTEQWDPRKGNSWNHFMMGQIEEWFFNTLAGIRYDEKQPGFKHILLQPTPVGDLKNVSASTETLYGKMAVAWTKTGKQFNLKVTIPVNTTTTVTLPFATTSVRVNGKAVTVKDNSVELGSGKWEIEETL
ncbi:MAG: glycoside hydrolase family 78 protein [Bacteroidota bacterium]|nr:glycoside hydrolase family 78 protein [Bacteroidota bacterium]